jgi:hypothetical protein
MVDVGKEDLDSGEAAEDGEAGDRAEGVEGGGSSRMLGCNLS